MLEQQFGKFLEQLGQKRSVPLSMRLWDGTKVDLSPQPLAIVKLNRPSAAQYLLRPTLDKLGRAYVEGEIDVEGRVRDLIAAAEALAREGSPGAQAGLLPSAWRSLHSRKSDRESIRYHYDVSNEFYSLWLDTQMVYSCAYFRSDTDSLEAAQTQKLEHVCRKLLLRPGLRLLDIGSGWGALLIHAARHYGVRGVGITLSEQQLLESRARAKALGLENQVEFRLQDYRDLPGDEPFDRISSIGMVEHVGLANLGAYFRVIHKLLVPGGVLLNHGISSSDPDSRSVGLGAGKFIDEYVFPNGELPHVALAIRELSLAGLELTDAESLRRHYAQTLWHWSDRFEQNFERLRAIAGEKRARVWRVYLPGCAHAFSQGWINIYQLQAVKPVAGNPGEFPVPLTRDYLYRPDGS